MSDLENGIDLRKVAVEKNLKIKRSPTFEDLLDEYWKVELNKSPTGSERRRLVRKDALKPWRHKKVAEITQLSHEPVAKSEEKNSLPHHQPTFRWNHRITSLIRI